MNNVNFRSTISIFNLPLLLLAVFGLVLGGCTTKIRNEGATPGIHVRADDAPNARIHMNSVNIIDPGLQYVVEDEGRYYGKIAVEKHGTRRSATNTLEVFVLLRNRTSHNLMIEGRIQFYDENEFPIEGPTTWQRVSIPQNGVAVYKEFSTSFKIGFYYVEIREAR